MKKILSSLVLFIILNVLVGSTAFAYDDDRYLRAITGLTEYIDNNPEDANGYMSRGEVYSQNFQFELAILDFNRVIEINPSYAKVYATRGYIYRIKHEFEAALTDYNKAIELMPAMAGYYSDRGGVYMDMKMFTEAIQDYTKALELKPTSEQTYKFRIYAYCGKGQYDLAIASCNSFMGKNPRDTGIYYNKAHVYETLIEKFPLSISASQAKRRIQYINRCIQTGTVL